MIHGPYDDQLPQSIVCTRFLISYIVWPSEYIAIEEDAVRPLQGVTPSSFWAGWDGSRDRRHGRYAVVRGVR
jgi:hypothetical protein